MKKIAILLSFLPLFTIAQSKFGIAAGGSYGKTASYSIGFTSQKVLSIIGFNAEYKGATDYDLKQSYYSTGKIKYSALAGININIKKFVISLNGGMSFIDSPKYVENYNGAASGPLKRACYEGLIGYNVIEKDKFTLNLRAGYNNNYGGIVSIGFLF